MIIFCSHMKHVSSFKCVRLKVNVAFYFFYYCVLQVVFLRGAHDFIWFLYPDYSVIMFNMRTILHYNSVLSERKSYEDVNKICLKTDIRCCFLSWIFRCSMAEHFGFYGFAAVLFKRSRGLSKLILRSFSPLGKLSALTLKGH